MNRMRSTDDSANLKLRTLFFKCNTFLCSCQKKIPIKGYFHINLNKQLHSFPVVLNSDVQFSSWNKYCILTKSQVCQSLELQR